MPANLTILTPAAQPIAHFENYAPIFCEQIFMLMTLLNFESQQAPKPVDPELCHSKKLFLRLFFGKNPHFHPFWPNVDPPFTYIVGKVWISAFYPCSPIQDLMILQAVRILLTLREWFVHASSQCVLNKFLMMMKTSDLKIKPFGDEMLNIDKKFYSDQIYVLNVL